MSGEGVTFDDVIGWLSTIDGLAVLAPGVTVGSLPAVTVMPGRLEVMTGNRYVREHMELRVMVPLLPFDTQYRELLKWTGKVLNVFGGTHVGLLSDIPLTFTSDQTNDSAPPHQAATISIDYSGRVMWPTT